MLERLFSVALIFKREIYNFAGLDYRGIYYSDSSYPILMAGIIVIALASKIIWLFLGRDRNSQKYSGYGVARYYFRGLISISLNTVPKITFVLATLLMLFALAKPFLNQFKEETRVTESRIRVDLRDISQSMELPFPGSEKSKAQVAAESHLEFLKMRKGKNDRTSFWLFASFPHKVEDFIIDDELYFQQVEDSYWITGYLQDSIGKFFQGNPKYYIPEERYGFISGDGGGTDIILALRAVIKALDDDEKFLKQSGTNTSGIFRSILMISDAEVFEFPQAELKGLRDRHIIPYVIWIRTLGGEPPEFAKALSNYGGKYFDASDPKSLKEAYETIDRLEAVNINVITKSFKVPLFQDFILMTILLLIFAVLVALIMEPFGVYP